MAVSHAVQPQPSMLVGNGIMDRLREETRGHHARAEEGQLERALVRGELPRPAFLELLKQRYLMHRTLERHVQELTQRDARLAGILHEELYQEHNLLADLEFHGIDVARVEPLPATAAFLSWLHELPAQQPLALLGVYYVFEGSKNGAAYFVKSLRRAYGLADGRGLRYFDPHGERQRPLWMAFKAAMNGVTFTETEMDQMVSAAQRTFDCVAAVDEEIHDRAAAAALGTDVPETGIPGEIKGFYAH